MTLILKALTENYIEFTGTVPDKIELITQAGSPRKYYRFYKNSDTILGVYSNNIPETETFLYFSEVFDSLEMNVPKIYFVSANKNCYFIEDFGDDLLLNIVEKEKRENGFSKRLIELYKKALSALARMQVTAAGYLDFSKSYSISEFDSQAISFDLNYFKYYFLNQTGINYDEKKLQDDFDSFANSLSSEGWKFFMFRDFQARNIIVKNGEPFFIDYQGGRKGAPEYDVASLLYQAKAAIPEKIKKDLLDYYFDQLSTYVNVDKQNFYNRYYSFVYLRIMQTLGAYGLRGLIENKQHFLDSIPFAISNLANLTKTNPVLSSYFELSRILDQVSMLTGFEKTIYSEFTINVFSFSYKKGIPKDKSGNGGGFVFDCRGIHNPGRYPEYKTKTGLDKEVIEFFKQSSEIDTFTENAIAIVKPTIENYIERGFNSLMIGFGCTGGQHRSVYCAEKITKFIRENYKVSVNLEHRELEIESI